MPSQPIDTGWSFDAVFDLIGSDFHVGSPTLSAASQATVRPIPKDDTTEHSPHLGDFSKLFDGLGLAQLPPGSPVDSEGLISSDDTAGPASDTQRLSVDGGKHTPDHVLVETDAEASDEELGDVASSDETLQPPTPLAPLTAKQQKQLRKKAAQKARRAKKAALLDAEEPGIEATQVDLPRVQSVGFKIHPATPSPPKVAPVAPKQEVPKPKPDPAPAVPATNAPVRQFNSLTQPFTPIRNVHNSSSKAEFNTPQRLPTSSHGRPVTPLTNNLVPRTVQPVNHPKVNDAKAAETGRSSSQHRTATPWQGPVATPVTHSTSTPVAQTPFTPSKPSGQLTIRPQTDRHLHLMNQLLASFPADVKYLVSPMQLFSQKTLVAEGIHCFVDASNIMIGFRDMLRRMGVTQLYDMSFDSLALLMERRRPVAKRIYAGSQREAAPLPHVTRLAETSKAVGYENLVKEQVFIRREDSSRKKFFRDVEKHGWTKATSIHARGNGNGNATASSGSGSDSETSTASASAPASAPKWVEQGVDEILHLHMCQSVIDAETPTTMVLATGDGNAAEFSDGFLAQVERALKKGWTVELVCWRQGMSAGYRKRAFREKWGEKFRVVELDGWVECLVDT